MYEIEQIDKIEKIDKFNAYYKCVKKLVKNRINESNVACLKISLDEKEKRGFALHVSKGKEFIFGVAVGISDADENTIFTVLADRNGQLGCETNLDSNYEVLIDLYKVSLRIESQLKVKVK